MGQNTNTGTFLYPADSLTLLYTKQQAHALEVPILAKYYFLGEHHSWRPFVTAGPSIRRTFVDSWYSSTILSGANLGSATVTPGINPKRVDWSVDPSFGAGVDVAIGRFHLEPEVRYSYWGAGSELPVRKNQVDFLLGFRFGGKK